MITLLPPKKWNFPQSLGTSWDEKIRKQNLSTILSSWDTAVCLHFRQKSKITIGSDFSSDFSSVCFPYFQSFFIKLFNTGLQCEFIRTFFKKAGGLRVMDFPPPQESSSLTPSAYYCLSMICWNQYREWSILISIKIAALKAFLELSLHSGIEIEK